MNKNLLSIVLPLYQEEDNVFPLIEEIEEVLLELIQKNELEIIAVDDGSSDKTLERLKEKSEHLKFLKIIAFRKNYGQAAAFNAGINAARGNFVATMDSDLQNDPRDILPMLEKLNDENTDFICGWRKKRQDESSRVAISKIANTLVRFVTGSKLHDLGCSLKVYKKEALEELELYGEMHRFINVLIEDQGFKSSEMIVNHRSRHSGTSKYGFIRTFKVILDLFFIWFLKSFQTKSIYVFGGVALSTMALSGFLALFVLYEKYSSNVFVHKNPIFILVVLLIIVSFQFLGLGLLSEVLTRTYFESQGKKYFKIKETIN